MRAHGDMHSRMRPCAYPNAQDDTRELELTKTLLLMLSLLCEGHNSPHTVMQVCARLPTCIFGCGLARVRRARVGMHSRMRTACRYAFPHARRMSVCIPVCAPHVGVHSRTRVPRATGAYPCCAAAQALMSSQPGLAKSVDVVGLVCALYTALEAAAAPGAPSIIVPLAIRCLQVRAWRYAFLYARPVRLTRIRVQVLVEFMQVGPLRLSAALAAC